MAHRELKFDLAELWLEYMGSLGTAQQKEADLKGFMNWCIGQVTNNA